MTMDTLKYHILPDLLPEEYEALKASIAERGVDIPKVVDQGGNTLDGRHRHAQTDGGAATRRHQGAR